MRLFGFITRIYHNERPPERQSDVKRDARCTPRQNDLLQVHLPFSVQSLLISVLAAIFAVCAMRMIGDWRCIL